MVETVPDQETTASWAGRYAAIGWAIFPVRPGGKIPITENGVLDATSDPEQVSWWWGEFPSANIGLACGTASNVWVLDVDPRSKGGATGLESLEALQIDNGPLPRTLESNTGGGGRHLFFRLPVGVTVRNRVNARKVVGIDVRGTGGYVVLPPSVHPSGLAYSWANRLPVADAPSWLYAIVGDPQQAPGPTWRPPVIPENADAMQRYAARALEHASERIRTAGEGGRHQALVEEASNLGRFAAAGVISEDSVADCLVAAGIAAGKSASEVRRTVAQQLEWARAHPKMPTLERR